MKAPFSLLALLTSSCFIFSCENKNSNNDIEPSKPTIEILSCSHALQSALICDELSNHVIEIEPGDLLTLQVSLEAAQDLSQYKIDIHENGDCHDHGERPLSEWTYSKVVDINGKTTIENIEINVPADAEHSNYHFKLQVVDKGGLESEPENLDLIVH